MVFGAFSWLGSCVDSYIIHVDGYTSFINQVVEYCVHHSLEGRWGVG